MAVAHAHVYSVLGTCMSRWGDCDAPKRHVEKPALAQEHSPTSVAAAQRISSPRGALRAKVLAYLQEQGPNGSTDEAGARATEMADNTYRPRRIELTEANLVEDSKRTRMTRSGRSAVVWRVR